MDKICSCVMLPVFQCYVQFFLTVLVGLVCTVSWHDCGTQQDTKVKRDHKHWALEAPEAVTATPGGT